MERRARERPEQRGARQRERCEVQRGSELKLALNDGSRSKPTDFSADKERRHSGEFSGVMLGFQRT